MVLLLYYSPRLGLMSGRFIEFFVPFQQTLQKGNIQLAKRDSDELALRTESGDSSTKKTGRAVSAAWMDFRHLQKERFSEVPLVG